MFQGLSPLVEAEPGFRFDTKLTTAVSVAPAMASGGGMPSVEARGIVPSAPGYQSVMKLQKAWAVASIGSNNVQFQTPAAIKASI